MMFNRLSHFLFWLSFILSQVRGNQSFFAQSTNQMIWVRSLLIEMVDFEKLVQRPDLFFTESMASSYDWKSHEGCDRCNQDYLRTINNSKRHSLSRICFRCWKRNKQFVWFQFSGMKNSAVSDESIHFKTIKKRMFGYSFC